ncbi:MULTISPECIES: ABC transporter permease [Priestia]|uniref:ABC transporter permease n=1 Tax=Priestia TaxID=2800373 RepID=UPI000AA13595|nr:MULTISPECIES: ABC transporter permease [Priestia]MDI3091866.1 ABC transporter permease [Priestia megaterium]MEC1070277.1 ABC transporter permease [Priestia megaterium]MED3863897.1 ABC transporter permease [Priestia megaterium]MED4101047.1 ABC transporter permease [Priestia megaterium]MED4145400.1 ABC transporter permease [Priestia megaterium]
MKKTLWLFCLKRLASLPIILLGVSLLTFFLMRIVPIEPAEVILRLSGVTPTTESIRSLEKEMGLNLPLFEQYWLWLKDVLSLQFGTSFVSKLPVAEELLNKFPATALLAISSFFLALTISVPSGIISALYPYSFINKFVQMLSIISVSLPTFWLGFMLIYIFSVQLNLLPTNGTGSLIHLILPTCTLAIPIIGLFTQTIQTSMTRELVKPYIDYAYQRGISKKVIIFKHVLKHTLTPLLSLFGLTLGNLMAGAIVVEQVFSWPGVGRYLIESIINRDYPVIQSYVLIVAVLYVCINLCTDIIQRLLDPRIKESSYD